MIWQVRSKILIARSRAELYNNRGLAYHYQGDLAAAIDDYSRSLHQLRLAGSVESMGERMASTRLNRGVAYRDQGLTSAVGAAQRETLCAAAADLQQVVELTPDPALVQEARQHLADVERLLRVQEMTA